MNIHEFNYFVKKYMPDFLYPMMIQYKYKKNMGIACNLNNPQKYTEKMQWTKLYRTDPLLSKLSDKIEVRKWVEKKIGKEYLVPTVGNIYTCADEIDFGNLPEQFVIKANHGSGYNIVVDNIKELDIEAVRGKLNDWLKHDFAFNSFEFQYRNISPKIYIEKYLSVGNSGDLPDYKFFCFGGKVFCSYTMINYTRDHKQGKMGFFDRDYNLLPYYRLDFKRLETQLPKPQNYEKMVEIAETLSEGFSHVRVDLYNIEGKIYFGEMTFTTNSGYCLFSPKEFDTILGDQWDLHFGV